VERLEAASVPLEETSAGTMVRDPSENAILLHVA
jgi:hypothetical protein